MTGKKGVSDDYFRNADHLLIIIEKPKRQNHMHKPNNIPKLK